MKLEKGKEALLYVDESRRKLNSRYYKAFKKMGLSGL